MPQEIRLATFNVLNLSMPGMQLYDNLAPHSVAEYEAKTSWIAQQMDLLNADVIGFQEIFSQAALKHVLSKTQSYQQAHHVGFDPDPLAERLTPSVALVSRLPLAGPATAFSDFSRNLSISLPDDAGRAAGSSHFTRPVLHAQVKVSDDLAINVFVVHLKSKRPDFLDSELEDDPHHFGMASLRSLIRRGTEALGLRYLLTDFAQGNRIPLVVMGDFNDVAGAVTTQMVLGAGRSSKTGFDHRLFDCYRIRTRRDPLRDVGYTDIREDRYETIDHILVSEEFNPASRFAIGEVTDVTYLNDHVALKLPEASDHGQVVACISLFGNLQAPSVP